MQNDQEIFADNAAPFNTIKLLSAGYDGNVRKHIVDIAAQTVSKESQLTAQSTKSVTIVQHQSIIRSMAMSIDTHTLFVTMKVTGIITQFQKEDSSLNYYPVRTFKGNTNGIKSISLSNSKMHLLSASHDKTLRVWNLENGTQLACLNKEEKWHQSAIQSCCWNDQDTLFASGDYNGLIVVGSPPLSIYNTSNQFIPLCKFKADNQRLTCLKFQENGLDLFASYYQVQVIRLWSINEKELLDSKQTHQQNATLPIIQQPKQESEKLNGWTESFDVRRNILVVAVEEEMLSLSADSLQSMADAVKFVNVHTQKITSLVFSKDGKYVASGSWDKSVAIFDSKIGKCLKHIKKAYSKLIVEVVFEN